MPIPMAARGTEMRRCWQELRAGGCRWGRLIEIEQAELGEGGGEVVVVGAAPDGVAFQLEDQDAGVAETFAALHVEAGVGVLHYDALVGGVHGTHCELEILHRGTDTGEVGGDSLATP